MKLLFNRNPNPRLAVAVARYLKMGIQPNRPPLSATRPMRAPQMPLHH